MKILFNLVSALRKILQLCPDKTGSSASYCKGCAQVSEGNGADVALARANPPATSAVPKAETK